MRRLPGAVWLGGAILAAVVLLALLGPWIEPYPFDEFDVVSRLAPPSLLHWCGTDEFGRDVLSRLMHGAAYAPRLPPTAGSKLPIAFISPRYPTCIRSSAGTGPLR